MNNIITQKEKNMSEQEVNGIAIADLVLAANIIDLALQRGAFKAAEATQVGDCFAKIVEFVRANTPDVDEAADANAPETEVGG